jgi:hypothetical protein
MQMKHGVSIPGMEMSAYIQKVTGETWASEQKLTCSDGNWGGFSVSVASGEEVGDIIVLKYSIPDWKELSDEEKDKIIEIMSQDSQNYRLNLNVDCTQVN